MGLIDELNHALVARYRKEIDPAVLSDAMRWFAARIGAEKLDKLLLNFVEQFPQRCRLSRQADRAEWLKGTPKACPTAKPPSKS
jgi:hypothetical protein